MKKSFAKLALVGALSFASSMALAEEITVFAASSMTNVLQKIGEAYQAENPKDNVKFVFASSSVLAKQIEQDAPADLFVSADKKWMDYVAEKQPKLTHNRLDLVKNDLVLIAPKESALKESSVQAVDFKKILSDSYLAVGDPDHVPAGIYAKKALTHFNLWNEVESRLARAKNVRDALFLVERGESPLGIVYSTDAKITDKVKVIATFPQESYGEVVYPAALLSQKAEGKRFLDFLTSEKAKGYFEQAGFKPAK